MIRFALCSCLGLAGCLSAVAPLEPPSYHNPLDSKDAGPTDGGIPGSDGGATSSQGMVLSRRPDLTSAVYFVGSSDAGSPRTAIVLGDVAGLCDAIQADGGGLDNDWDLVHLRLDGDTSSTYPVAAALGPSGAVAGFQFRSDAGGFGTAVATSGTVELGALPTREISRAPRIYRLTFSATDSLSGRFSAKPCSALAPRAGGD